MMSTAAMDDPDSQELLSMQLKKKKKKAKKVDISTLDAEIEKLAATEESVVNTDSASTRQPVDTDQSASVSALDDELGLNLKKKKKKKRGILPDDILMDTSLKEDDKPQPQSNPPLSIEPITTDLALEPIQESSQVSTIDYELPPKKKKRKPNIVFEGFEEQVKEVTGDEEWEKDPNDIEMDDIEPMDISPWAGTDRDYSYEELLERIFNIMKQRNPGMVERKTRLVMKPPQVMRVGAKRTTFANFTDICKLLHRQPKHVFAFLLAELGTSGSIDGNNQLIIKGRFQQKQIETVLKRYIKEYVTCHTCRSPETILQRENRLFFLQCETCGSRCSVQSVKSGFQAVTNRAQMRSRQT